MRSPILDDCWPHPWIQGLCPQDGSFPSCSRPPPPCQHRSPTHSGDSLLLVVGHPGFRSPDSSAWMRVFGHPPSESQTGISPRNRCFLLVRRRGRNGGGCRLFSFGLPRCYPQLKAFTSRAKFCLVVPPGFSRGTPEWNEHRMGLEILP